MKRRQPRSFVIRSRSALTIALLTGAFVLPSPMSPLSSPAHAMVVVERDFPDLVQRAEDIVAGTVSDVRNAQKESGAPTTLVTVSDLTALKGNARDSITLEFYGGVAGDYTIRVSDMPTFHPGDRVVLFIAGNGENVCPLVGVWQGSFRIRFDETLGTDIITTNGGTPVGGIVGGRVQPIESGGDGGGGAVAMTLDSFRQSIADELVSSDRQPR